MELRPQDLLIETFPVDGQPGRMETGVRITHVPSGIVVTSSSAKTQLQNRLIAVDLLREKI